MVITYTAVGRIQALTWDITICIRRIVGVEPIGAAKIIASEGLFHGAPPEPREDLPGMDEDLFCAI
jgi:hypothetical protein